jgi:hypothetical protein
MIERQVQIEDQYRLKGLPRFGHRLRIHHYRLPSVARHDAHSGPSRELTRACPDRRAILPARGYN